MTVCCQHARVAAGNSGGFKQPDFQIELHRNDRLHGNESCEPLRLLSNGSAEVGARLRYDFGKYIWMVMSSAGRRQARETVPHDDRILGIKSETLLKLEPGEDFLDQRITPLFVATHFTVAGVARTIPDQDGRYRRDISRGN